MRRLTPKKIEKVRTNVYLARASKEKAQKVLKEYGLNLSEAFNLFLAIIAETEKLPFEFKIPNKTTRQAMEEVIAGKNVEEITLEDLVSEASVKKT